MAVIEMRSMFRKSNGSFKGRRNAPCGHINVATQRVPDDLGLLVDLFAMKWR